MKVILVSDTHRNTEVLDYLRRTYPDADAFVHCGDLEIPFERAADFIAVRGNMDFDPQYPWERVEEFEGNRVLITHGHGYLKPWDRDDLTPLATAASSVSSCGDPSTSPHPSTTDSCTPRPSSCSMMANATGLTRSRRSR